ncbi:MAG: cbb3-type cytochrome c oxidase subunit I [Pseudomonadota bacterium]
MDILGRLSWQSLPFAAVLDRPTLSDVIAAGAASLVILAGIAVLYLLSRHRLWVPLWRGWLTSLDHKRIGVMYVVLALVMLVRAVIEAALMRFQQADGPGGGFLTADHYSQLFSTHGTIMIFFMAMPFLTGLINIVVPLQIGARDVSFPLLNAISLGLTAAGAALVMVSLVVGDFSTGGWSGYPPYTEAAFNPGEGPDYWIWAVALAGFGTTMSGINFAVTIYKERAPGMTFFRLPMFTWTALCTAILMIFALPPLTVATLTLALDRYLGFHFFTNDLGGNMMNFANLFWLFGHPEVYILILPAFGVFSEVFATFSGKRLYGYPSLVIATMSIAVLSFTVWVHHFFTMGQSASLNAAFGAATMTIGVPTGVKIYDWMATMYRGRVRLAVPMIYALGFLMLFVIGGLTGILLANPTIDYQVHNTLFLVAHFHNMLIPGFLFGMLAGYTYWFPKVFGFRLDEVWGRRSAVAWILGYMLVFFPLYWVGLLGMTRRTVSYQEAAFQPWMLISGFGALVVLFAMGALAAQLVVSIRHRQALAVPAGDPWDGRTLEWSLPAPVPEWNFAQVPDVTARDAWWEDKRRGRLAAPSAYEDIALPRHSVLGMVFAVFGAALGFALVWHIWWLAVASVLVLAASVIGRSFVTRTETVIAAARIEAEDRRFRALREAAMPVGRDAEETCANRGRADREAFA